MTIPSAYAAFCAGRRATHQFRTLRPTAILSQGRAQRGDAELVNFASNDYLGLSQHPALIARARACAERYGAGVTASRLVTGNHPLYAEIESMLALGKGYETALVLAGGYQTNLTVLAALADADVIGRPVTVLADRLSHHSLLQGAQLSGARLLRFRHNDLGHLETLLRQRSQAGDALMIVTESVFGMDGDRADLVALGTLAKTCGALLYVDEAHATGLFGAQGFGLAAGLAGAVDVAMGTFGKALGGFGSYIACAADLRDYLIQRCGGLVYSTGLPPATLGAMQAALDLIPHLHTERVRLMQSAEHLRAALRRQGWDCGAGDTHIIPVILGDEQAAETLAAHLGDAGFLVPAIRPPTVPRGTSRLRISLSAAHSAIDIDRLIEAMAQAVRRAA
jgi:8-amino-7-oxononanoate synthase